MDTQKLRMRLLALTKFINNEIFIQSMAKFFIRLTDIDESVPTFAYTDGVRINFNPNFEVDNLSIKNNNNLLLFVYIHEILHIILNHPKRHEEISKIYNVKDVRIHNIAMDLAVNSIIKESGIFDDSFVNKLSDFVLMPEKFDLPDLKSYEYYFREIMRQLKEFQNQNGLDESSLESCIAQDNKKGCDNITLYDINTGKNKNCKVPDDVNKDLIEQVYNNTTKYLDIHNFSNGNSGSDNDIVNQIRSIYEYIKVLEKTKDIGKGSTALLRQLEQLFTQKIDWRSALQNYLDIIFTRSDRSYTKVNRRLLPLKRIMPYDWSEDKIIKDVMIAIDVSGSISDKELAYFISELKNMFAEFDSENIKIVPFSTRIYESIELEKFDVNEFLKNIQFKTDCGTAIEPVIKLYNKSDNYNLLIIFTDGYIDDWIKSNKEIIVIVNNYDVKIPRDYHTVRFSMN